MTAAERATLRTLSFCKAKIGVKMCATKEISSLVELGYVVVTAKGNYQITSVGRVQLEKEGQL